MPVARFDLEKNLEELQTKNSMLVTAADIERWTKNLSSHLRQVCLPLERNSILLRGARNDDSSSNMAIKERRLFAEAAIASQSVRVNRLELINQLEGIKKRGNAQPSAKSGTDALIELHAALKDVAEDIARAANADVDPQRVCPFEQSPEVVALIGKTTKAAWEQGIRRPGEVRTLINKAVDQLRCETLQDYIEQTYPERKGPEIPPEMTGTELRTLGYTYYKAFGALELDLSDEQIADSIAKAMAGGQRCRRWTSEKEGYTASAYWLQQMQKNFAEPAEYRYLKSVQAFDSAPPIEVARTVRANCAIERFPVADVRIEYCDRNSSENEESRAAELLRDSLDHNTVLVLPGSGGGQAPALVRGLSENTPNVLQVMKPGHNCKNVVLPESANAEDKLEAIIECASQLQPIVPAAKAASEVDTLWEQWRNISLGSPEQTTNERAEIVGRAKALASKMPPPGYGGEINKYATSGLVTLVMMAGTTEDIAETMAFRPPQGLNNLELDIEPEVRAYKAPGDNSSTTHVTIKVRGCDDAHYQNVPNADVSELILTHHREEGGVLGVSSNVPGMVCYYSDDKGMPHPIGHWMDEEDRKELLETSPLALTNRNAAGESALFAPLSSEYEQRVDDWIASTVALTMPGETSDVTLELAIELALYNADIPLKMTDDDFVGSTKASIGRFVVEELIDHPEDLRTGVMQRIAQSSELSDSERQDRIERIKHGDWATALGWVEALYGHEPGEAWESPAPAMR